jgi:hypothetical protein
LASEPVFDAGTPFAIADARFKDVTGDRAELAESLDGLGRFNGSSAPFRVFNRKSTGRADRRGVLLILGSLLVGDGDGTRGRARVREALESAQILAGFLTASELIPCGIRHD